MIKEIFNNMIQIKNQMEKIIKIQKEKEKIKMLKLIKFHIKKHIRL
jgi:hypothetical protein